MLPNFIILGTQKGGTTSLHHYLSFHPDIVMSSIKETNYFIQEYNWIKGEKWYQSLFKGNGKVYGEASPNYTNYPVFEGVAERMFVHLPEAKLIFLARDPIDRLVSHYLDQVKQYNEERHFEELVQSINFEDTEYIQRSRYFYQLDHFLQYYSRKQLLILDSKDLKVNRTNVLKKVYQFLGVREDFDCPEIKKEKNVNAEKYKRRKAARWVRFLLAEDTWLSPVKKIFPLSWRQQTEDWLWPKGEKIERPELTEKILGRIRPLLVKDAEHFRNLSGLKFEHWKI